MMKSSTLDLLCCPSCQGELSTHVEYHNEIVNNGTIFCLHCERSFLILNNIVYFIDPKEIEDLDRRIARFYDWFASLYPLFTKVALFPFGGDRKARKEILDRLELKGGRILEVSIGSGANLPYLFESPTVGEVFGLDISGGQLMRCSNFITERGWSIDLFHGTAEAMPFKAESFDSVFHIGGINFFSHKKEAIEEMIRVARPGSKIVIADESERVARFIARMPGFSSSYQGKKLDLSVPVHLVPNTMEEKRVDGIWKAHGKYHGYCLEFRKPA
jgi:ubiquinone/menaquinone biosynthesis C-methylase UbiE